MEPSFTAAAPLPACFGRDVPRLCLDAGMPLKAKSTETQWAGDTFCVRHNLVCDEMLSSPWQSALWVLPGDRRCLVQFPLAQTSSLCIWKESVLPRFSLRPSMKKTKQRLSSLLSFRQAELTPEKKNPRALWVSAYRSWSWHSRAELHMLQKAK